MGNLQAFLAGSGVIVLFVGLIKTVLEIRKLLRDARKNGKKNGDGDQASTPKPTLHMPTPDEVAKYGKKLATSPGGKLGLFLILLGIVLLAGSSDALKNLPALLPFPKLK